MSFLLKILLALCIWEACHCCQRWSPNSLAWFPRPSALFLALSNVSKYILWFAYVNQMNLINVLKTCSRIPLFMLLFLFLFLSANVIINIIGLFRYSSRIEHNSWHNSDLLNDWIFPPFRVYAALIIFTNNLLLSKFFTLFNFNIPF